MTFDDVLLTPELVQPAPAVTNPEAVSLATDEFGLEVSSITALPSERDRAFHVVDQQGREFVLRVIHPAEDPNVTDFQTCALLHAAEADPSLSAPRVVASVRDGAHDVAWDTPGVPRRRVRCVTYVAGEPLGETPRTASQLRSLGGFLARLDRALTEFRHPAENRDLLWDIKRADRASELVRFVSDVDARAMCERAFSRFAQHVVPVLPSLRAQAIHNDFNPQNILVAPGRTNVVAGVIDFGDMVRAPLIQDLATAAAYQVKGEGHPFGAVVEIACAFHALYPLQIPELMVLPDLIATRLAVAAVVSSWRASLYPENASYILKNTDTVLSNLRRVDALGREETLAWLYRRVSSSTYRDYGLWHLKSGSTRAVV